MLPQIVFSLWINLNFAWDLTGGTHVVSMKQIRTEQTILVGKREYIT